MKNPLAVKILMGLLFLGYLAALAFFTLLLSNFYKLFGAGLPGWVSDGLAVGLAVVAFLTSICATALQGKAGPWPAWTSTAALLLVWGGVIYAMSLTAPPDHLYVVLGLSCAVPITTLFAGRVLGDLFTLLQQLERERAEQLRREDEAHTLDEAVRQQRGRDHVRPAVPQPATPPSAIPEDSEVRLEAPPAAPSLELDSEQSALAASKPQDAPAEPAETAQTWIRPVSGDVQTGDPRRASRAVSVDRSQTPQSVPHPVGGVPATGESVQEEPAVEVLSQAEADSTTDISSDRNASRSGPNSRSTVLQPDPQIDEAGLKESAAESSSTPNPKQETSVAMNRPSPVATGAQAPPAEPAVKVRSRSGSGRAGAGKASGASPASSVSRPPAPQTYASAVALIPEDFLTLTGVSRQVFKEQLDVLRAREAARKGRGRTPEQPLEERLMMRLLHGTGRVTYRQVAQIYDIAETSVSRTVTAISSMLEEKE